MTSYSGLGTNKEIANLDSTSLSPVVVCGFRKKFRDLIGSFRCSGTCFEEVARHVPHFYTLGLYSLYGDGQVCRRWKKILSDLKGNIYLFYCVVSRTTRSIQAFCCISNLKVGKDRERILNVGCIVKLHVSCHFR
jgi:hypothetical protein